MGAGLAVYLPRGSGEGFCLNVCAKCKERAAAEQTGVKLSRTGSEALLGFSCCLEEVRSATCPISPAMLLLSRP